jgi:nucleotidyltransferase substrate binding protein (TIGR01987 family)
MSTEFDIRWEQRFSNFRKALAQLNEFINHGELNRLEEQGLVKAFEYTYELAWNALRDFLTHQGVEDLIGSRDTFRKAFTEGLIEDGHLWMSMIASRNRTSHTYNETTAQEIVEEIRAKFHPAFQQLEATLVQRLT